MSKRFTETKKWSDGWFLSLANDYRIIWLWLVDNCSIAGFWKKDFESLNFFCKPSSPIDELRFKEIFNGRCLDLEQYFFIPKFLKVQYPQGLTSNKPLIISVRKELSKLLNNDYSMIKQSLGNDYLIIPLHSLMIKGKGKGKGKGKDKDKEYFELIKKEGMQGEGDEREEVLGNLQEKKSDDEKFNLFWEAYPKRKSKGQAEKAWLKIKPSEQLLATMLAKIEQATTSEDWMKEGGKYIPYPATWLNAKGWEDEYKPAITQGTSKTAGNWALLEQRKREREKAGIQT